MPRIPLSVLLPCVSLLAACASPVAPLGEIDSGSAPSAFELEILQRADKQASDLQARGLVLDDPEVQSWIDSVAQTVISDVLRSHRPVRVHVLRAGDVNAFALPNGDIYMTVAFLSHVQNETQLAFALAHEMAHVEHRDGLAYASSRKRVALTASIVDTLLAGTGVAYLPAGADLAQFSRETEERADAVAVQAIIDAGYDPARLEGFFTIFSQAEKGFHFLGDVFASHPDDEARSEAIRALAARAAKPGPYRPERDLAPLHRRVFVESCQAALRQGQYLKLRDWLDTLEPEMAQAPDSLCYRAEALRMAAEELEKNPPRKSRSKRKDKEVPSVPDLYQQAAEAYDLALQADPAHARAIRGSGLLAIDRRDAATARDFLSRYLQMPESSLEHRYIEYLIDSLHEEEPSTPPAVP